MKTRTVSLNHPSVQLEKLVGRKALHTNQEGEEVVATLETFKSWPKYLAARMPNGSWSWVHGPLVTLVEED